MQYENSELMYLETIIMEMENDPNSNQKGTKSLGDPIPTSMIMGGRVLIIITTI